MKTRNKNGISPGGRKGMQLIPTLEDTKEGTWTASFSRWMKCDQLMETISLTGRCLHNSSHKYNDCSKSGLGGVLIQLCCSNPGPYPQRWKGRETLVWTDDQSKRHMFALQGWLSHELVSGIHVNHRSHTFRNEHSCNQYPWAAENIKNSAR